MSSLNTDSFKVKNRHVFEFVDIIDKAIYERYIRNDATLEKYVYREGSKIDYGKTLNEVSRHVDNSDMEEWINSIGFDFACSELRSIESFIDEDILEDNWEKALKIELIVTSY